MSIPPIWLIHSEVELGPLKNTEVTIIKMRISNKNETNKQGKEPDNLPPQWTTRFPLATTRRARVVGIKSRKM